MQIWYESSIFCTNFYKEIFLWSFLIHCDKKYVCIKSGFAIKGIQKSCSLELTHSTLNLLLHLVSILFCTPIPQGPCIRVGFENTTTSITLNKNFMIKIQKWYIHSVSNCVCVSSKNLWSLWFDSRL